VPRSRDLVIFVSIDRLANRLLHPLLHMRARGVIVAALPSNAQQNCYGYRVCECERPLPQDAWYKINYCIVGIFGEVFIVVIP
jgi:hypothetical protein